MIPFIPDAARWRTLRAEYIQAARDCKAALTRPDGCWRYSPDDPRVRKAVESWLHRARNAHAFALGRKPVIANFLYVGPEGTYQGPLYAAGARAAA